MTNSDILDSFTLKTTNSKNIADLKALNEAVLPVVYSKRVYEQIVYFGDRFSFVVYDNNKPIAAVACRLEDKDLATYKINIMTLVVLDDYRQKGIGTALVKRILRAAKEQPRVVEAYLNVLETNTGAVKLYERLGFSVTSFIPNYYQKLEPSGCYVLVKKV
jgi:ribosomal-protein-alanine N-acetyltransferase